ncbi:MAG: glycosyltransferase [Phycisphaerae bacterium]
MMEESRSEMAGLHILIVPAWWPSPRQPDSGVFFRDYAGAFAAAGARVGVVYPDLVSLRGWRPGSGIPWMPAVTAERVENIAVLRIQGWHTAGGLPGIRFSRFRAWLRRGLAAYRARHGDPDLLHAMCAIPSGWACTHLPDELAKPVVVTEHTGPFSLVMTRKAGRAYVRAALDRAAAVVAVSGRTRDEMRAAGITREIDVCGNMVAPEFLSAEVPAAHPGAARRGVFVGRLTPAKGAGDLLIAIEAMADRRDVEWHLVGDGSLASDARALASRPAMGGRLHVCGVCDRTEVVARMSRSDFLVLPTHGESFGLVVAEALCLGLPVLTTEDTACAEFVHPRNGILVRMRDPESLRAGLSRMVDTCLEYDRHAIAREARDRFSGRRVAGWYARLFRRVLDVRSEGR